MRGRSVRVRGARRVCLSVRPDLSTEQDKWGQFGDFIGGFLNPLIALLGLLGVFATLILNAKAIAQATTTIREQQRQNWESRLYDMVWKFWETDFYVKRNSAWHIGQAIHTSILVLRDGSVLEYPIRDQARRVENPSDEQKAFAEELLDAVIGWHTIGLPSHRHGVWSALKRFDSVFPKNKLELPTEPNALDSEVKLATRAFSEVLHFFALYSFVVTECREERLHALLGNQWSWWGPVLKPYVNIMTERCPELDQSAYPDAIWIKSPNALWESQIPRLSEYYDRIWGRSK